MHQGSYLGKMSECDLDPNPPFLCLHGGLVSDCYVTNLNRTHQPSLLFPQGSQVVRCVDATSYFRLVCHTPLYLSTGSIPRQQAMGETQSKGGPSSDSVSPEQQDPEDN